MLVNHSALSLQWPISFIHLNKLLFPLFLACILALIGLTLQARSPVFDRLALVTPCIKPLGLPLPARAAIRYTPILKPSKGSSSYYVTKQSSKSSGLMTANGVKYFIIINSCVIVFLW